MNKDVRHAALGLGRRGFQRFYGPRPPIRIRNGPRGPKAQRPENHLIGL